MTTLLSGWGERIRSCLHYHALMPKKQSAQQLWLVQVSVKILGGLMALGYEIGTIMKRTSTSYSDDKICIKLDDIEGMDQTFVQVAFPLIAGLWAGSFEEASEANV